MIGIYSKEDGFLYYGNLNEIPEQEPSLALYELNPTLAHQNILFLYCPYNFHSKVYNINPEGPYTLPMELGPQKTIPIMVLGPNSIMVVYVGPSG